MSSRTLQTTLLAILMLAGCKEKTPPPAPPTPVVQGPSIELDRMSHDFGPVSDGRSLRTSFTVRNVGSERLVIRSVTPNCNCMDADPLGWQVEPGSATTIDVDYAPTARRGARSFNIRIVTNDLRNAVTTIEITSFVDPMAVVDPPMVEFGRLPVGNPHRAYVTFSATDPDVELVDAKCTTPEISTAIGASNRGATIRPGRPGRIVVELTASDKIPWGYHDEYLTVRLRAKTHLQDEEPILRVLQIPVRIVLDGRITARPLPKFLLNIVPRGEPTDKSLELVSTDGIAFNVISAGIADSSSPDVTVSIVPQGVEAERFILTLRTNLPSGFTGAVEGTVRVRTDRDGYTVLNIPFSGQSG